MTVKRVTDVIIALVALLLLWPLLLAGAALVWLSLGRPVFLVQMRPGLGGVPFGLLKLRTMREACDENGAPLPDAERLGRCGRFLRASSIDEIPQLWNVLRGDMSLVGPRPLMMEYLPLYSPRQMRRHEVKPGLTGWAQINGRNSLDWDSRLERDVWYVENRGFAMDLTILARTVLCVLARRGIVQSGSATMDRFRGTSSV